MPEAPPRPCGQPGCGELVIGSDHCCEEHRRDQHRAIDALRGSLPSQSDVGGVTQKLEQLRG